MPGGNDAFSCRFVQVCMTILLPPGIKGGEENYRWEESANSQKYFQKPTSAKSTPVISVSIYDVQ